MVAVVTVAVVMLQCSMADAFVQHSQPSFVSSSIQQRSAAFPALKASPNDNDENSDSTKAADMNGVEEYKNVATKVLSNFMQEEDSEEAIEDPLDQIDWNNTPKIPPTTTLATLAQALDYELTQREWFVTGDVNPAYFADTFEFQDPDVQLKGIEAYARGVRKLFNQKTARAEIIETVVNADGGITCTWRLSGDINIGFNGLPIKPYICYTDFTVDTETSLITQQEDRFDIPQWDILLSSLFPFLIGTVTSEPAPPVAKRGGLVMPRLGGGKNSMRVLQTLFGK
eukprot:CAMPEP_0198125240 /NCGR_PEP_ID=MMETSP1442-20131203/42134_1 /TAXON_ID= /ORGANISM="Craspedostauros australis, Strain CCMP3328" /LENGTH=283 /DNA_ID=CAMNT_0043784809 /DNA_START=148 /DNA_END=999 /DNA_ORIENTATION=+